MQTVGQAIRFNAATCLLGCLFVGCVLNVREPSDVADEIALAERFAQWDKVEKLAPSFEMRAPSDLPALAAVLNACAVRACDEQSLIGNLRGALVTNELKEFASAWLEFIARNPLLARLRFEALAAEGPSSWLGHYGRLSLAIDSENAKLLEAAIRDSRPAAARVPLIADMLVDAELASAMLSHDYERIPAILRPIKELGPVQLLARFEYLVWKDEIAQAAAALDEYVARFGEDHDAAPAKVALALLRIPPQEAMRLAEKKLSLYPAYWRLRLMLPSLLVETGQESSARRLLESGEGLPLQFAYVRLQRDESLAYFDGMSKERLEALGAAFKPFADYPGAHAALAAAHVGHGNIAEAERELAISESQNSEYPAAIDLRAQIAAMSGRSAEAIGLYRRVATFSPNSINRKLILAYAYLAAKDSTAAWKVVSEIRSSPRFVDPERLEVLERALSDLR